MPHRDSQRPPPVASTSQSAARAQRAARAPEPASEPQPLIGDRYRVVEALGRGGMGIVYRVYDPGTDADLALKQLALPEGSRESSQVISAFEREFYMLSQLAHPHVIAVYDYGIDPAGPFYTMELLDGGDLKALAPLGVARACQLLLEVCSSLALLHARRLVHRDISPRNIRCTRDGHAKLLDFGAVVPMGPCTHTVGTPAFVAPEVVHHSTLDARADLFSLGATLYYTLTGRAPFAARTFSDLREAWGAPFVLPSRWVPSIPPALDALCASLLRIEPAQRPRSVFDVMQRLQAIAGIAFDEPEGASEAYLTTPALVGREDLLRRFRQRMRHALHGHGDALLFESEPGMGRSRLLDACALEAKTLGAIVLRAAASAGSEVRFAVAEQLAEQLLQVLPEVAGVVAHAVGVRELLFQSAAVDDEMLRLRSFRDPKLDRAQLQAALGSWLLQVCDSHALLIAIDDVQRVDEDSLALLAALSIQAKQIRLLVTVSCDTSGLQQASAALPVLKQHASTYTLRALTRDETQALLTSAFGNVPHVQVLADRVFQIALGVPRETLALVQHLIDAGAIRYADGQWTLPRELDGSALPRSAADALATRIRALPPLARRFAEAQALLGSVLRREDYSVLAPEAGTAERDAAITTLLTQEILQSDGEFYRLSHRTLSDMLCELLDADQKRARHLALYELYRAQPNSHHYLIVHHLLEAGRHEQALDLLAQNKHGTTEQSDVDAALRAGPKRLAEILERALELSQQLGRPALEVHELRRKRCSLGMLTTEETWFTRVAPAWLAQLERDSGLAAYRALPANLEPAARLQQALQLAAANYAATPEPQRVYRVDAAIKHLALYGVCLLTVSHRAEDPQLTKQLPSLLEPFTPLAPALFAVRQFCLARIAAADGRLLEAHRCALDAYERLGQIPDQAVRFNNSIRYAAAATIGALDARLGRATAFEWADKLDADPGSAVVAFQVRCAAALMRGDTEAAEIHARDAELRSLRSSARLLYNSSWTMELHASVYMRDLAGVKRAVDGIAALAHGRPGWTAHLCLAQGHFELIRGDIDAAHAAFSRSIELARPAGQPQKFHLETWAQALSGLMAATTERGALSEAIALGERAVASCEAAGVDVAKQSVLTALALAEAKQGLLERAKTRIDAVIAAQQLYDIHGLALAHSYAVRASIAIWSRDAEAAARFASLTLAEPGGDKVLAATAQREPLFAQARQAGLEIALAPTEFEASVLGTHRAVSIQADSTQLDEALRGCHDKASRTARVLGLLCDLSDAPSGHLYLVGDDQQLALAATQHTRAPDQEALRFALGFFAQQLDDECFSAGLTQATHMLSLPGAASYIDGRGHEHRVLTLTCKHESELVYIGLAVLATKPAQNLPRLGPQLLAQLPVLANLLLAARDTVGIKPSDVHARAADP